MKEFDEYLNDEHIQHHLRSRIPQRSRVADLMDGINEILFPGFAGSQGVSVEKATGDLTAKFEETKELLFDLLQCASEYRWEGASDKEQVCDVQQVGNEFLQSLPVIRSALLKDAEAAYRGDPAACHPDEVILCYPGFEAMRTHRVAHFLLKRGVPLLPRIMSEISHMRTGIDIHPRAQIGDSFFIDHGTGVTIGETSVIGSGCTLYQGVTLGAKSVRDYQGDLLRGQKRHPTLGNNVTVYAAATILGGDTVIGDGCIINGGVFLTHSVPPRHIVRGPKLEVTLRKDPRQKD